MTVDAPAQPAIPASPTPVPPAPPGLRPVAPGIHLIRMPLPFALDHVNLWAIEDGEGWMLVDTGMATEACKAGWDHLFAGELAGRPVTGLIITHYHPDHCGLAGWLADRLGVTPRMIDTEWRQVTRMRGLSDADYGAGVLAFFLAHGLEPARAARLAERGNPLARRMAELPKRIDALAEDDEFTIGGRRWQVRIGRGHVQAHACLWCPEAGVLIAGDQILPRISPNVSVQWWLPDADPLSDFLASTAEFAGMPADTLVLPSHGQPFQTLPGRCAELIRHHADRLAEAEAACRAAPRTAVEILPLLFRRELDDHQIVFALGEGVAHLRHLARQGRLVERVEGGITRFAAP